MTEKNVLTVKQENFCLAYLETGNASEAYRRSYSASKMKPATINRNAKAMLSDNKITTRIDALRVPVIKKAQINLESHLDDLMILRDIAKEKGQISAAVTAETARGKAAGLYVERVEVKNIFEEMSEDARKARIAQLLEKALASV